MSDRPWYPLRDARRHLLMTRYNVTIEVQWGHWTGTAIYVGPPQTARPWWGEPRRSGVTPLPPRKVISYRDTPNGVAIDTSPAWLDRNGWGAEPDRWRPVAGREWNDQLPAPLLIRPSIEGRFARIDHVAFNAAESAAEIEAERRWRQGRKDDEEELSIDAWWRDGTLVTYSDAGAITPRECEGRVMRALYWLGKGGDRLFASTNSPLASLVAESLSSDHMPDARDLPRLARMPNETDDRLLEAMAWLTEMTVTSRAAARWLSLLVHMTRDSRVTFSGAGASVSTTGYYAKIMRSSALLRLTQIANTGTPTVARYGAEVIERNRAHARAIAG